MARWWCSKLQKGGGVVAGSSKGKAKRQQSMQQQAGKHAARWKAGMPARCVVLPGMWQSSLPNMCHSSGAEEGDCMRKLPAFRRKEEQKTKPEDRGRRW